MARNDSSIFLNSNGVSVMKITWYSASTHTTVSPTAASQNVLAFIRESLLVLHDQNGHAVPEGSRVEKTCVEKTRVEKTCSEIFHKQKIFVGFKISWGQPSTKIGSLENLSHEIFLP